MSVHSFVDRVPPKPEPPVKVRALLSFLPSDDGGRNSPAYSGYRPNHNFGRPDNREFYIGQVTFGANETIKPGESKEVQIEFINGPGLLEALKSGRPWRIQEGPRLVATAKLLDILDET
jgi:translation elongation factor EF-Tu-like GTPase